MRFSVLESCICKGDVQLFWLWFIIKCNKNRFAEKMHPGFTAVGNQHLLVMCHVKQVCPLFEGNWHSNLWYTCRAKGYCTPLHNYCPAILNKSVHQKQGAFLFLHELTNKCDKSVFLKECAFLFASIRSELSNSSVMQKRRTFLFWMNLYSPGTKAFF